VTLRPPLTSFSIRRVNATLHGRSVHRPEDVSGHNVFRGYNAPGTGDALDVFCSAGTPVVALADCVQTRHANDGTRKEVIYLTGDGWLAVYAHIDAASNNTGTSYEAGQEVGRVRGDLSDPHLHFELWRDGQTRAVNAATPRGLQVALAGMMTGGTTVAIKVIGPDGRLLTDEGEWRGDGRVWVPVRAVAEGAGLEVDGSHVRDQHKVYLTREVQT
jgi:hypothetical protein